MLFLLYTRPEAVILAVAGLLITLVCLFSIWKGESQRVSQLLILSLWLTFVASAFHMGGLQSASSLYFAVIIAFAYLNFGVRWGVGFGLASIVAIGVMFVGHQRGWIETIDWMNMEGGIWLFGLNYLASLVAVVVVLWVASGTLLHAQGAWRESQSRFDHLVKHIDDMFWVISAENATPLYVSDAYTTISGKAEIDLYDNPNAWREIVHPDDLGIFTQRFSGSAEKQLTYRIIDARGRVRWVWSRIWPIRDDEGTLTSFAGIVSDVTDKRRSDDAMRQAQKLESLGLLAGGIAHDFNNLLVAIMGQASLANAKLDAAHPSQAHISKTLDAAERAKLLVQQMLAYSGQTTTLIRPLNFNDLIENNLQLLSTSIPSDVKLDKTFMRMLPLVEADESQMQQVIMNLILNAAQSGGDSIRVKTGARTVSAETLSHWNFAGDALTPGEYVSIEIEDDGCGINAETQKSIFDPFFTTKSSGTGLGLSAVLGIMRAHNGGISVYSEVGMGTTFRLLLPVYSMIDEALDELTFDTELPQKEIFSQVLIVDDEHTVTEVVADMLELEGIPTMTANSGVQAIELYRQKRDDIGLIVLDMTMPGMNGEEVFAALQDIDPSVNVLVSSGYSQKEVTRRLEPIAPAGFIQKPFDIRTLISEIRTRL